MPVRGDPHFPYTRIVDRTSGHLAVRVGRNRYGYVSIEDMAEQFPGLTFQGSGSADVASISRSGTHNYKILAP